MLRKLMILLAAAAALTGPDCAEETATAPAGATQADKPQIDKAKLEAYLRHLFVWPPPIEMTIGDPEARPDARLL